MNHAHVCAYGMVHELFMNLSWYYFGVEDVIIKALNGSHGDICVTV